MRRFDLLLFDFDGTLCRTREAIHYSIEKTFERFQVPSPCASELDATIGEGLGLSETFLRCNPSLGSEAVAAWVTTYRQIYNGGDGQARTTLFEGAREVLASLSASGLAIAVVSNKGREAIVTALEHFGLAPHTSLVIGHAAKPKPDSFHEAVAAHAPGIPASRTLMVGDTVADLLYARNIGASSCWAAYGYGLPAQCAAAEPDHTVHSLAELLPWLAN